MNRGDPKLWLLASVQWSYDALRIEGRKNECDSEYLLSDRE